MRNFSYSWPMHSRVFRQAELMDRMMARVGVNPAVAARVDQGAAWFEARTNCISSCHEHVCRNWLERSERLSMPPDFCPNAEFFRSCLDRSSIDVSTMPRQSSNDLP